MVQGCLLVIKKACGEECDKRCPQELCGNFPTACHITEKDIGVCSGHVRMLEEYLVTFLDLKITWKKEHPISLEGVFEMAKDEALKEYLDKKPEGLEKDDLLKTLRVIDILAQGLLTEN